MLEIFSNSSFFFCGPEIYLPFLTTMTSCKERQVSTISRLLLIGYKSGLVFFLNLGKNSENIVLFVEYDCFANRTFRLDKVADFFVKSPLLLIFFISLPFFALCT